MDNGTKYWCPSLAYIILEYFSTYVRKLGGAISEIILEITSEVMHLRIYVRNVLRSAISDTVSDITSEIISEVMSEMMSLKLLLHQYLSYTLLILESYTPQLDYMGYSLENHKWSQIEAMHNGGALGRIVRSLVSSFVY